MPAAVRGERPSRGGRRGRRGPGRSEITSRPERREGRPATASSGYARRHRGPRDRNRSAWVSTEVFLWLSTPPSGVHSFLSFYVYVCVFLCICVYMYVHMGMYGCGCPWRTDWVSDPPEPKSQSSFEFWDSNLGPLHR